VFSGYGGVIVTSLRIGPVLAGAGGSSGLHEVGSRHPRGDSMGGASWWWDSDPVCLHTNRNI